jgi:predicted phage tail component-like protein
MGLSGLTFNGTHNSQYPITIKSKKRPFFAPINLTFQYIQGRPGALLQSKETDILTIPVDVLIEGIDSSDYRKVLRDVKGWLITDQAKELVFDDDPSITYFGILSGKTDLDELVRIGEGTIYFICPDSYEYGSERRQIINDPTVTNENPLITNTGTTETFPRFKATIQKPITFLDIISPEDYMRIGNPVAVDETPIEREQLILHDTLASTTGWGAGSQVDGGVVAGTMASDGNNFIVSDYGVGTNQWHGPALKTSLSEALQDFKLEARVKLDNLGGGVGRIEVYLLDANNAIIGKISVRDSWPEGKRMWGETRAGTLDAGHKFMSEYYDYPHKWNPFDGLLRVQRVGNKWESYITLIFPDGKHSYWNTRTYIDVDSKYMQQITQVQLHIAAFTPTSGTQYKVTDNRISDLKVYKINTNTEKQIPYIAVAGDVIEFDHSKSLITKNGEDFLSEKDFAANFFPLGVGDTEIAVQPSDAAVVEAVWKPRWL